MKNHVYYFGLLLVGVCLANAFDLSRQFNFQSPNIEGAPSLSVDVSGNAGDRNTFQSSLKQSMENIRSSINQFAENALLQSTSRLRQVLNIPDDAFKAYISSIPGLKGLFSGSYSIPGVSIPSSFSDLLQPKLPGNSQQSRSDFLGGLPQIPGLPQQTGNPSSPLGLPQIPDLPGLPQQGSDSSSPFNLLPKFGLPSLPGLPQQGSGFSSPFGLPQLPNIPGLSQQGSGSPVGNLPGILGLPSSSVLQIPNLLDSNGIPKISLPGIPGLPGLPDVNSIAFALGSAEAKNLLGVLDVSSLSSPLTNGTVESALNNLQSISDNAAKEAKASTDNALSNLQTYGKSISQEIDNVSKSAQAQINTTMQRLSSDVKDCVNKNGNPGSAGVEAARQSAQRCVQNKINEASSIVNGTLRDIEAAQLGVNYLRGNLSNCQLNVSASLTSLPTFSASKPACIASALLSIQSETILLPINMASHAAQAVSLVQGLQAYALKCVATLMEDIAKSTLTTTLAVGKCYADKQT